MSFRSHRRSEDSNRSPRLRAAPRFRSRRRALTSRCRGTRARTTDALRGRSTGFVGLPRSEEHTSELQSLAYLVCRLLLEKKKKSTRAATVYAHSQSHCHDSTLTYQRRIALSDRP